MDNDAVVKSLTKAQRGDMARAIFTKGRWWVPCPATGLPLIMRGGDLTDDGLAVRASLHDTVHTNSKTKDTDDGE